MQPFPGKSVIGLTGGIACGKSTALQMFARCGWSAISTDQLAGEILADDKNVSDLLRERWGESVVDKQGNIDKSEIAEIIFSTNHEKIWLESVLHPLVRTAWHHSIENSDRSLFVVEVPLLFENDLQSHFAHTISIFASHEIQVERLLARGLSPEQAQSRIDAQFTSERKAVLADFVLLSCGSEEFLEQQVHFFLKSFKSKQPES